MSARTRPLIAIDGPVGAGKSTVARRLAGALGFNYLNTGAMYRAVAVAARDNGLAPNESEEAQTDARLKQLLAAITITFEGEQVLLNGRDISAQIAEPAIGELASRLSTRAVVRAELRRLQRAAGAAGGVVMEGRDIGTVIFPDAEVKFFLTAELTVRAARRFAELQAAGNALSEAEVLAQLTQRDQRDQQRALAPLKPAADAIVIDCSALSVGEVVRAMIAHVTSHAHAMQGLKRG